MLSSDRFETDQRACGENFLVPGVGNAECLSPFCIALIVLTESASEATDANLSEDTAVSVGAAGELGGEGQASYLPVHATYKYLPMEVPDEASERQVRYEVSRSNARSKVTIHGHGYGYGGIFSLWMIATSTRMPTPLIPSLTSSHYRL